MNSITFQADYDQTLVVKQRETVLSQFINWTKEEQKNRIAWVGISINLMTAIFFPITMASILAHGVTFKLIIGAMVSLVLVVVPNLAALPTRYTIPAFLTGVLIDLLLIIGSFVL